MPRWEFAAGFQFSVLNSSHESSESGSLGSRVSEASGIAAASFCSAAEKDIAESPTAEPGRPENRMTNDKRLMTKGYQRQQSTDNGQQTLCDVPDF